MGNIIYLEKTLKDSTFVYTSLLEEPEFLKDNSNVDLVYVGSLSENAQKKFLKKMMPFKEEIKNKIDKGQAFLATGNAFELFGEYILQEDNEKIDCLGIYRTYAKQQMMKRINHFCLADINDGIYKDIEIVGFKSQFAQSYILDNSDIPFIANVKRGIGINENSNKEIIKINNFYSTYILGPFLPINSKFTKVFLKTLGYDGDLAFEKEAMDAYYKRLEEFKDLNRDIN